MLLTAVLCGSRCLLRRAGCALAANCVELQALEATMRLAEECGGTACIHTCKGLSVHMWCAAARQ